MVVQHNLPAMNSHRQLGVNNSGTAKNLEKLSSGYRVNRAGDDAAGLAISEKMRGQIRGLNMASQNAQNGVSLIQTAEGGLNETHAILQRMRELAVQSANGTYHDDVDRENINKEVQALKSEVDRISSSTHYNGINLLDGSLGGKTVESMDAAKVPAAIIDLGFAAPANTLQLKAGGKDFVGQDAKLVVSAQDGNSTVSLQIGDKAYKLYETAAGVGKDFIDWDENGNSIVIASLSGDFTAANAKGSGVIVVKELADTAGTHKTLQEKANVIADEKSQLVFQIGANGSADQRVGLHVGNMSSGNLGSVKPDAAGGTTILGGYKVIDVDVSTREKANASIKVLDDAINQVSGTRADLGALQNRLEHTIQNLGVTAENLQAAESSIRDVDMAKEMMEFTKNNILVQASQAMLAQSNMQPQGVLQLLR